MDEKLMFMTEPELNIYDSLAELLHEQASHLRAPGRFLQHGDTKDVLLY